jgi:hypothetical protein
MRNPFEYGRELGPGELADRETEVAEARDVLTSGRKHFLIGPRRFGKTSVHNVAAHAARKAGAAVLRYNAEAYGSIDQLLAAIIADAARFIPGPLARVEASVRDVFRAVRPELSYNPMDQTWSVTVGLRETAARVPALVETLHGLEAAARKAGRPVGLVLDEVQTLLGGGIDAERQLRAAVQEHRRVGYLFAGSDTRLLTAMVNDPERPFYRLGSVRFLAEVPRPAFVAFLAAGFAPLRAAAGEDALVAILDAAEDVPYNVQLLAHHCWHALRDEGRGARLTPAVVETTHVATARRLDPVYSQQWLGLTAPQRRALQVIATEGTSGLFGAQVGRRYGMSATLMQKAVTALVDKRICWRQPRAGATRLRLEDPLFGTWVRTTITPAGA